MFKKIILILSLNVILIASGQSAKALEDWGQSAPLLPEEEQVEGWVIMDKRFLDDDILEISVHAKDMIAPILGIAFHLKYDSENLAFLRYTPGDFLEKGGDPFYLVENNPQRKELVFGETLRRDDAFPIGEGKIVDFYFQVINDSGYIFEFSDAVISTLEIVRQDLQNIVWRNLHIEKQGISGFFSSIKKIGKNSTIQNNKILFASLLLSILSGLSIFIFLKVRNNFRKRNITV